ncbi:MAG: EamA family transporter [Actinobacteria bacterium]|nr:EamA family transporter [Actinomycetota bacterium]
MTSSHNDYRMGRSDWLLLLMPGLIWGSSFFFIAEGLDAFQPALITPLRVLFGFLALVALPQSRKHIPRKDLPSIALLGVFWMVIPLSLFPFAEQHVSSSVTGMLNGATPLFVVTVTSLMHKSFPHRNQLLGLLVGFCGVLLIAIPTANNNSSSKFGVALIMCALCCYGIALNLAVPLQKKYGALPVIVRALAVALILTAPFGIAAIPNSSFAWHSLFAMVGLGVGGTGIAYALATTLAGRVGSTRTSVTTYIIPVVALFLGAIVRDEIVAGLSLVGCGVALTGAFLTNRSRK